MVHYKLYYFNIRARAEPIRMILTAAGQDYEDVVFTREQWPEFKKHAPLGQAPWLEIDGQKFSQSHALERYLAKAHGLAGKNAVENLRCDQIVDAILDITNNHLVFKYILKDENAKAGAKKNWQESSVPATFKILNEMAGNDGYFVGNSLTWADINFFCCLQWIHNDATPAITLDTYPKLKQIAQKVKNHPRLASYLQNRS